MTLSATCTATLGLKFNGKPIQFLAYIVHCNTKNTTYFVPKWTVDSSQKAVDIWHNTFDIGKLSQDNKNGQFTLVNSKCWHSFPVLEQLSSVGAAFQCTHSFLLDRYLLISVKNCCRHSISDFGHGQWKQRPLKRVLDTKGCGPWHMKIPGSPMYRQF